MQDTGGADAGRRRPWKTTQTNPFVTNVYRVRIAVQPTARNVTVTTCGIGISPGPTRNGRNGASVAQWGLQGAAGEWRTMNLIDLLDHPLPHLEEPIPAMAGRYTSPQTIAWADHISGFDGFIIVTPEYNHGVPGMLNNALHHLYAEWNTKAVCMADVSTQVELSVLPELEEGQAHLQAGQDRALAQVFVQVYARTPGGMLDIHKATGQEAVHTAGLWEPFRALIHPGGEAMRILNRHGVAHRVRVAAVRGDGSGRHEVEFTDGETISTDLLISSDGAWSRVRRLLFGAHPAYTGITFIEVDLFDADSNHPKEASIMGQGLLFAIDGDTGILGHCEFAQ
ncbi:NAD(P)H-dependent oxidoreductase [Arthrobacter livingstonensis]|uniref:NAD(P)H-dependent oxidoreductase n=1 Tax=Arthrobacter livingstonensis TaxID=670078 RepID=UPI001FE9B354|nr:NAD(P)H-dependent oxidoreductase [Arthrobacter livingstonensis]